MYKIFLLLLLVCNSFILVAQIESFNGYERTYFEIDPTSSISEEILAVTYDKNGYAWVLAISGLYRYDNKELINFNNLAHNTDFIEWGRIVGNPILFDGNKLLFIFVGIKSRYAIVNVDDYSVKEGSIVSMGDKSREINRRLAKTVDGKLRVIEKLGDHVVEVSRVDFENNRFVPIKKYYFQKKITFFSDVYLSSIDEDFIVLNTENQLISSDTSYEDLLNQVNRCFKNDNFNYLVSFDAINDRIYYSSETCAGINVINMDSRTISKVEGIPDEEFHLHFQDSQGNKLFLIKRDVRAIRNVYLYSVDSTVTNLSASIQIDENTTAYASPDFDKSISVATYNGFYNYHKKETSPFDNYLVGDKQGTRFGVTIRGISEITDSTYLIAREVNKFYKFNSNTKKVEDFPIYDSETGMPLTTHSCCYDLSPLIDSFVYTIVCNAVTMHGTQGIRSYKINVFTGECTSISFPITGSNIKYDGDSTLIIGTNYSRGMPTNLVLYNVYTEEVTDFYKHIRAESTIPLTNIKDIQIDKNGNYWLGTEIGLRQINPERTEFIDHVFEFSVEPHRSSPDIFEMCYLEEKNMLAIATSAIGVVLYDIDNKSSTLVSTRTGLLSNTIYNLSRNENYLYIGSEVGLSIYDLDMKRVLYTYKIEDGLTDNELNRNSSIVSNGFGFFGTVNGLNVADLSKLKVQNSGLDILIDKLYVRDIDENIIQAFHNIKSDQTIKISNQASSIDVTLAQPLAPAGKLRYLVEVNNNEGENIVKYYKNHFSLNRASKGLVKVDATTFYNDNGLKRSRSTFSLEYLPTYYERPLFWIASGVLSLIGMIFFYRIIVSIGRRKERERLALQSQFAEYELRALRSQMNPHFLFNAITGIQYFIADKNIVLAEKYLAKFGKLMRLILENSRKKLIPLGDELNLIYNYIDLERMRMDGRFDYSVNVDEIIDKETTYVPSMIIQPFVENSLIHGLFHYQEADGFLKIDITQNSAGAITCIIQDNGIGRVRSREINNKSHRKHKSRAYEIITERIEALKQIGYFLSLHTVDLYDLDGDSIGTKVILEFYTVSKNDHLSDEINQSYDSALNI